MIILGNYINVGLLTRLNNVVILRKEFKFKNSSSAANRNPKPIEYEWLYLNLLRSYLSFEF